MQMTLGESKGWLMWTALFLTVMVGAVMLGSGLEATQAAPAQVPQVAKSINVSAIEPGQVPVPVYTVVFSNVGDADLVLDAVTDTLPSGFDFIDMYPGSGWTRSPDDADEPEIVWLGPITVSAHSTLTFRYAVYVPTSVLPTSTLYTNVVRAVTDDGTPVGPAMASLLVGAPEVSVAKMVTPTRVLHGELVTYTVIFSNSGQLTGTFDSIVDTLDASLSFTGMVSGSDLGTPDQIVGNMLVWTGPFDVSPGETLALKYQVQTPAGPGWFWPRNHVVGDLDDGSIVEADTQILVGPEKAYMYLPSLLKNFRYAYLDVTKSAYPTLLPAEPGQVVTYTVVIKNVGDTTGTMTSIYDTLPAGFTFSAMVAGSDIGDNPSGTTGTITWNGSWEMPPGREIRLIYQVIANPAVGTYTNRANVTAQAAFVPVEPASANVTVEQRVLLQDNFDEAIEFSWDSWKPFTNYWRVKPPEQWYWGSNDGVNGSGAMTHDCTKGKADPERGAEDGLMMWMGEGSENWTDYRVTVRMFLRGGMDDGQFVLEGGYPIGLWVRGQLLELEDNYGGGNITGYYVVAGGKPGKQAFVKLSQLQTLTDCWDLACDNPQNLYDFNNPHELALQKLPDLTFERYQWYTLTVEVEGNRIRAWLNGILAIDYVDEKEPFLTGTVGFKTYKSWTASFDEILVEPLH